MRRRTRRWVIGLGALLAVALLVGGVLRLRQQQVPAPPSAPPPAPTATPPNYPPPEGTVSTAPPITGAEAHDATTGLTPSAVMRMGETGYTTRYLQKVGADTPQTRRAARQTYHIMRRIFTTQAIGKLPASQQQWLRKAREALGDVTVAISALEQGKTRAFPSADIASPQEAGEAARVELLPCAAAPPRDARARAEATRKLAAVTRVYAALPPTIPADAQGWQNTYATGRQELHDALQTLTTLLPTLPDAAALRLTTFCATQATMLARQPFVKPATTSATPAPRSTAPPAGAGSG